MNFCANIITVLNLLGGFLSVIFSFKGYFALAGWAILLSLVFDGLDGQIARLNSIPSQFGKQMDSLVDAISFGAAPVILAFVFLYGNLEFKIIPVLFLYLVCSIIRLSKYNILPQEPCGSGKFSGLPITVSGGLIASFIILANRFKIWQEHVILTVLALLAAIMMISFRIKYPNLNTLIKFFHFNKTVFFVMFIAGLAGLVIPFVLGALFLPEAIILAFILIYLIFSPFMLKLLLSKY